VRTFLPPILVFVLATLLAEGLVRGGVVRDYLFPAPSQVARALAAHRAELSKKAVDTATAAVVGFALSSAFGMVAAIVLSSGGWVQRAFYPYAVFFQTVPIIAVAPLLVIWFSFDIKAVIASSFIVSIFPVIANTLSGLLSTDPALRDLFRLYGAGRFSSLIKLRLPFALPSILTGLRIAAGLAVIGAIVGEFITGAGLGGLIQVARQQQAVDKVFAALLLSALLGVALFGLVNLISRFALRHWHASEKSNETPTPRRGFAVVVRDRLQPRR
jgi:NitT/TauT family transport system permease protein